MSTFIHTLRRVVPIALAWAVVWLAFWAAAGGIIVIVDPNSIDPGEGWLMVTVLGPMGLLTGIVFATLLTLARRRPTPGDLPWLPVSGRGVLSAALVQLAYLGHGDQGFAANLQMAALFSAIGGVVTMAWLALTRHGRPRHQPVTRTQPESRIG